jgi:hypothetical protein
MARTVATSTRVSLPERDPATSVLVLSDESLIRITPTRWGPIATGGFPADVAARLDAL